MIIKDLTVLNAEKPIGTGKKPYFSWKIESEKKNTFQKSYRLQVSDHNGNIVMDTGIVESDKNAYIVYDGKVLESRSEYFVKVHVADSNNDEADAETVFETGLLKHEDWSAQWIISPNKRKKNKQGFRKQYPSTLFRKEVKIEPSFKKARLYATAHGAYELYINGVRPDERSFAPEHTVYEKYLCYQTYDVTDLLKSGKNVIGFHVGDGYYFCLNTKPNMKTDNQHAVLFQLEVEYDDGKVLSIGSDKNVLTKEGPVVSSDLFAGEAYDANREIGAWCTLDCELNGWLNCKEKKYGYDNLVAQNSDKVLPIRVLDVKDVIYNDKGECILDFGQNLAGRIRYKDFLKKGDVIRFEHCEVLNKNREYYNNALQAGGVGGGCDQTDEYVSDGQEKTYEPHFTYHGFRYVKVSINGKTPEQIETERFKAVALSSEKKNTGTFECSDELLNRLYSNIRWSQYSNMLSIPTDCPQREKAGWTGDMLVYSKTAMLNEDCTLMFSRWLENMSLEQDRYGVIPMVVPENGNYPMMGKIMTLTAGGKGKGTSSGWGDASVIVPYSMYEVTDNTEVLKKQYFTMRRWCDFIIDRAKNYKPKKCNTPEQYEKYLWDTGYHYGEWLIPSQSKNGLDMKNLKAIMAESSCYTAPIFGWNSVNTFAKIAEILNREDENNALYANDVTKYQVIADKMKDAIQNVIISKDGSMPSELMGAYVLPIYFDLVPDEIKDAFNKKLVDIIEKNDRIMDTGFLTTPYLLDALCKIGRRDLAYALLYQKKAPSWLSEVLQGGTTIWENCFGYDADGNPGNLSFNHYAFGSVADWIFRNIAGIIPTSAGYRTFRVNPDLECGLKSASRTFETINGTIEVKWKINDQKYILDVRVPCNTSAEIILPSGKTETIGNGEYHYEEQISL